MFTQRLKITSNPLHQPRVRQGSHIPRRSARLVEHLMHRLVIDGANVLPFAGKKVRLTRRVEINAQRHPNPWLLANQCRVVLLSIAIVNHLKRLAAILACHFAVESFQQLRIFQIKIGKHLPPDLVEPLPVVWQTRWHRVDYDW